MGLDFSHCEAHWAYSGFARFRNKLAEQIGLHGYNDIGDTADPKFEPFKKDPIIHLLAHSDCDGHLTPKQCAKVAPRLREIVSAWPDSDYDKVKALELVEGMELAAKENQKLKFC